MPRPLLPREYVRRFFKPSAERLENRWVLSAAVPLIDLAEGNASAWTAFASDNQPATVSNNSTYLREGSKSLKFVTESGFDTGIRLAAPTGNWDVSAVNLFEFWMYGENDTPIGFQGNQPIIHLVSTTGTLKLTPTSQLTPNKAWGVVHAPLAGNSQWTRTETGTFDAKNVTALEIHQDTWDAGFTVYYDGMHFANRSDATLPPAGPKPPAGVKADAIAPRVLLYVFDPILENQGNVSSHEAYGWQDPQALTSQIVESLATDSHGLVNYNVVDTIIADVHPYYKNGFQHTDASFSADWAARDFSKQASGFDYVRFINENNLVERVDSGDLDEVWIYASPFGGMWEASMAGQGAYWINGPTQNVPSTRAFPIMGWNYERGVAEALHSYGHRAESTLDHIYGTQGSAIENNWDKFAYQDRYNPGAGLGGIGNIHFPVNGVSDYDYGNTSFVVSNADDWYNYPNFQGTTRSINRSEWQRDDGNWQLGYMDWWYDHLPHFGGRGTDFLLNNWWRYLTDINQFKYGGANLALTRGVPQVKTLAPQINGLVGKVEAEAFVDGALGRVDLYVDGVYHSTDTIAPYKFEFFLDSLAAGTHTLRTKAYELQRGTETVSAPVTFTKGGITLSGSTTYMENATPVVLAPYASVGANGVWRDVKLTVNVSFQGTDDDRLAFKKQGNGSGQINVAQTQLLYAGVAVGEIAGGKGSTPLTVVFNDQARTASVQAAVRAITFRTLGDDPSTAERTVSFTLGNAPQATKIVKVVAVNDAPTLLVSGSVGYKLNNPAVAVAPTASVKDPDSANFAGGVLRVKITDGVASSNRLTIAGSFTVQAGKVMLGTVQIGTLNTNGGVGTTDLAITLTSKATRAITQDLLRAVRFKTSNGASTVKRTITFTLSDGDGKTSLPVNKTIHVSP